MTDVDLGRWTDADEPEPLEEPDLDTIEATLPATSGHVASTDADWTIAHAVPELPEREDDHPPRAVDENIPFAPELPYTVEVPTRPYRRHMDGWSFVFSVPETVPAIWGERQTVGWAKGEGLFIVGPDGVGKTTVEQQLMLGRVGLRDELFGLPIEPAPGCVLYLSCDRPRQAASSLRRMVSAKDEQVLRERLAVWRGPIPVNLNDPKQPSTALLEWIRTEFGDVSDVFIDSLKDIALDLGKDETGSRVNMALQELIADGIETVTSHHQRKELQGGGKPRRLADVYGSRWLTAGQGSVVCLWGEPGDAIVELSHLKQPVEALGPLAVLHDHSTGRSTLHEPVNLLGALRASGSVGMTPAGAAVVLFGDAAPDRNLIERARRKLNAMVSDDVLELAKDEQGLSHYVLKAAR